MGSVLEQRFQRVGLTRRVNGQRWTPPSRWLLGSPASAACPTPPSQAAALLPTVLPCPNARTRNPPFLRAFHRRSSRQQTSVALRAYPRSYRYMGPEVSHELCDGQSHNRRPPTEGMNVKPRTMVVHQAMHSVRLGEKPPSHHAHGKGPWNAYLNGTKLIAMLAGRQLMYVTEAIKGNPLSGGLKLSQG